MDHPPGSSLFQGVESIKLNNDLQRIEEEDAIEDRLRRNEEINNQLQNAFDDLIDQTENEDDDDEYSINNPIDAMNPGNMLLPNAGFNHMNANLQPRLNNDHGPDDVRHWKNKVASKNEEIRNITATFQSERITLQSQIEDLKKRLTIAESDKEHANMSRKQTHESLVESKQKISEQEEQIKELSAKIKLLDASKLEILTQLEQTKTLLTDTQHKYHMVEKDMRTERNTDSLVKHLKDQHAAQVDMMQQQINTMRTKFEDRDSEFKHLMIQYNELQKSRDGMMFEKSDLINHLNKRLDESQRQCQEMLERQNSNENSTQENIRLRREITSLEQKIEEMQRTINSLTTKLESTTTDLEHLTETAINNIEIDQVSPMTNGITETPLIRKAVSQPKLTVSSSTPMLAQERLMIQKMEFNRCLADLKSKQKENQALKEELTAKNLQIERLKGDENQALIELTMSKENAERLAIRLKNLERELGESQKNGATCNEEQPIKDDNELLNKLRQLESENKNFRLNCNHLNETIRALEDERDSIEEKYREACKDVAELQQKLSKIQPNTCLDCEKEKFLAKDAKQECTRLKEMYIQINDEKEEVMRKLRHMETLDINKELLEQRNMVASLERSLQLAEMKYTEISKILEREKMEHEKQIQNIRTKYEQEISSIGSKEQKDISNSCRKCIDLASEIAKLQIENLQIQTASSGHLKDIHELKKTIAKNEQTIKDLTRKLAMKEEHDRMLIELKGKANQFEEFMRNQSPTNCAMLDKIALNRNDKCVSTEDLFIMDSPRRPDSSSSNTGLDRSAERKIREELARSNAFKLKSIEDEYKNQLKDRDTDISNLKTCILKERLEMKHILEQNDIKTNELEVAAKRIQVLLNDLEQCRQEFQAERESTMKIMNEYKIELAKFAEREEQLMLQNQQMEMDHKVTVQSLNEKLMMAKKTAANYKQYSNDKEKHIERESERIRLAYEEAIENMKENMRMNMKEQEKQANKRIAKMQAELNALSVTRKL